MSYVLYFNVSHFEPGGMVVKTYYALLSGVMPMILDRTAYVVDDIILGSLSEEIPSKDIKFYFSLNDFFNKMEEVKNSKVIDKKILEEFSEINDKEVAKLFLTGEVYELLR